MSGASKASNQLDVQTDKVIVSEKAAGVSEDLTAITTHTTVQIASPSNSDITAVQNALSQ
jgi:hypothetical protein